MNGPRGGEAVEEAWRLAGAERQALLSGLGHPRASVCPQAYLVGTCEGSELLMVGVFKGEQRGWSTGSEKTVVHRVTQPFGKAKFVFITITNTPCFDCCCLPGLCT